MGYKITIAAASMALAAMAASHAHGAEPADGQAECNAFPAINGSDVAVGGSVAVSGLGKLAGGEIKGDYSKKDKRLLPDAPDTNRTAAVMALLAYHCRSAKGLSALERERQDKIFYEMVQALYGQPVERKPVRPKETARTANAPEKIKEDKPMIPPSVMQASALLRDAARTYKNALKPPYQAALGGSYIPVMPYELMRDDFMLSKATRQDLMEPVPNVVTVPEDATTSLGYNMCQGIRHGDQQVDSTMTRYSAKIPELLYSDIGKVRATAIYRYFSGFAAGSKCDVFLGNIRNRLDAKRGLPSEGQIVALHPIPAHLPNFSVDDYRAYIGAVQALDQNATSLSGGDETKKRE